MDVLNNMIMKYYTLFVNNALIPSLLLLLVHTVVAAVVVIYINRFETILTHVCLLNVFFFWNLVREWSRHLNPESSIS